MIQVELSRIIINERSDKQVIVLKEKEGQRAFPIVISIYEAMAIDRGVKELRTPRPLTHDLICLILKSLEVKLERVIVCDLRNDTFYAKLMLRKEEKSLEVDSRPSDAIALAVLQGAPIFVEEKVLGAILQTPESDFPPEETPPEQMP